MSSSIRTLFGRRLSHQDLKTSGSDPIAEPDTAWGLPTIPDQPRKEVPCHGSPLASLVAGEKHELQRLLSGLIN